MSLESVTEDLRQRAGRAASLGYKVKFDVGDGEFVHWDGTGATPVISNADAEADTTISITRDNLEKLLSGDLDPTFAYATGKIKVEGSVGVALKMASLLGD
ncbi:MAG: SCP2 sterol-binding domain-containing protein [Alphaproteobacteria bacterium]|nr:SCP2 sterol-binding domain-containing protein [Alphaproteobacteria bacterium]